MREIKVYSHELHRSKKSFPSLFWLYGLLIPIGIGLFLVDVIKGSIDQGYFALPGSITVIIGVIATVMYYFYKKDMREHPFLILRKDEVSVPYFLDIKSSFMWHPTYESAVNEYFDAKLKLKNAVDDQAWKDQFEKMNQTMKKIEKPLIFSNKTTPSRNYADELSIQANELNFKKE